ncbi:T9SS type A sorting domain-containing protein [uncultured Psychroserpens sp.]|uniref:T9SS type A sorting domain-containing protein n=1 Tax=uncultured Psychroserpens sp. TaxID=255436 RepID=UPI0026029C0B|nr:T9SS type A sorting domain-containing protein [uncultured Psychroserpens sp.]
MKVKLLFPLFALLFSITTFSQTLNQPNDMFVCDDNIPDGITEFDIESQTPLILGGLSPNDYTITYHVTEADALNQQNPLVSPYTNVSNPQTIYVNAFQNSTGNLEIFTFDLIVNSLPITNFAQDVVACDEGGGFATFDLTIFDAEFAQGNANLEVSYYETFQDADLGTNAITNPSVYINTVAYFQTLYVRVTDISSGCSYAHPNFALYLNVEEGIIINTPTPLVFCDVDDDGFGIFEIVSKDDEILGGNQNPNFIVTYHETQQDADNNVNPLSSPYNNIVAFNQTLFVRVGSVFGNCAQTTTLDLVVDIDCLSVSSATIQFCSDDPNLEVDFDLTSQNTNIVNGQDISGFNFTYYLTEADAENQSNPISNPTSYQYPVGTLIVYVHVEEIATGNTAITTLTVTGNLAPIVDYAGPYTICSGEEIVLTPLVSGGSGTYNYLWSIGATTPEIIVFEGGTYTVTVSDAITGCVSNTFTIEITEGESITLGDAADLSSCNPNEIFDLTVTIPEILLGADQNSYVIRFYENVNDAFFNVNPLAAPEAYTSNGVTQTIYVRVENTNDTCFALSDFNLVIETCPIDVVCGEEPVNTTYCYELNDATPYVYTSTDGSPLQVFFNAGQVEDTWDELVVLDSDGVTNLNPGSTTYGNGGDLTGLSFMSTGDTITIFVNSDDVFACVDQNYTPVDYTVSCIDLNALPICTSVLVLENGTEDVNENADLTWTASTGLVSGYKVSVGITPGGSEVIDNVDVGNVLTYDIGTLDYEVTYYVTILPYNDNGDAEGCNEQSFTTRANPNQLVECDGGAVNTTYCYGNNDTSEFGFESSDGLPLTVFFNTGGTEVTYDEISIIDSDGTVLNPTLPYGNDGDFAGLTYTSSGSSITVRFDTDGSVSCQAGSACCTEVFDFDVFCASSVGFIQVNAFVDANTNSVFDANEFNFSNGYFTYEVNGDGTINTVNSSTGNFQIISVNETDTYEITFNLYEESAGCYDVTTASFSNISVANGNTVTVDFPVVEEQSCEDLAVYLINNWTPPRPGFTHSNYLYLENLGFTTIASGTVEFTVDPQMVYNGTFNVNPAYTITATTTGFTVDFVNLQPGDVESIGISITCPASVELGDIVTNTATYITDTNDLVVVNNYSTLSEIVVGSWDPNDKMESHGPEIVFDDFVASDEYFYYTIRFQNLGTAPATFVRIEDMLDDQLDPTTFQMLRSSHDYVVTRTETDLEWFFDAINLPAEQDDEEGSRGFVYFKIKPKPGYAIGDIIPNTAAIYFDFNTPVITNRFDSEFVEFALSVSEVEVTSFDLFPNPAKDKVTIRLNSNAYGNVTANVIDIQGKQILEEQISEGNSMDLDTSNLQSGMYFVKVNTDRKSIVKKLIIE